MARRAEALRLAGATSSGRGEDYAAGGHVRGFGETEDWITARKSAARRYDVKLWIEGGSLETGDVAVVAVKKQERSSNSAARSMIAKMTHHVIRVSEAEAATDFRSLMAHVRAPDDHGRP